MCASSMTNGDVCFKKPNKSKREIEVAVTDAKQQKMHAGRDQVTIRCIDIEHGNRDRA